MPKRQWEATPIDDSPLMKAGDNYCVITRKNDEPDRLIRVNLGDATAARELATHLLAFVDRTAGPASDRSGGGR